ncbi:hypothetical protein LX36DRAFT_356198 [Colletotrichum falcatum]|nr:hypothetical protein LX36DRAFT_356198 [Colletotrichum falcatum]
MFRFGQIICNGNNTLASPLASFGSLDLPSPPLLRVSNIVSGPRRHSHVPRVVAHGCRANDFAFIRSRQGYIIDDTDQLVIRLVRPDPTRACTRLSEHEKRNVSLGLFGSAHQAVLDTETHGNETASLGQLSPLDQLRPRHPAPTRKRKRTRVDDADRIVIPISSSKLVWAVSSSGNSSSLSNQESSSRQGAKING